MLSNEMLMTINVRLQEIFGPEVFGRVNVLLFGDLLQLPPVQQRFIFERFNPKETGFCGSVANVVSLWSLFEYEELTQNVRQKGIVYIFIIISAFVHKPKLKPKVD